MRIVVAGAGYVGLVAGTCFAETGHEVILVDVDLQKIETLRRGEVPFYEPGLGDLLERNIREGRLSFTQDLGASIPKAKVVFIAVGTPQSHDGSADLKYVLQVASSVARAMVGPLVVVLKSTVPVGTADKVRAIMQAEGSHSAFIVSNPEFLKEGAAVDDFLKPDRVVVGCQEKEARQVMADLYEPFVRTNNPILFMDNLSAEVTKYCANGLLASRISFMNVVARLCHAVGADVDQVRVGVGSDSRIGQAFLFPGVGYGGSCFPKDVRALIRIGQEHGIPMEMLRATDEVNEVQKHLLSSLILERYGKDLSGRRFAVWGLAFKPRTDDMREAPSLMLIDDLLAAGATVLAYDPEARGTARKILGDRIDYADNEYEACQDADALVLVTEWNEFRRPDFERIRGLLKEPVLFDGRNIYDPRKLSDLGFDYTGIGRGAA